MQNEQVPTRLRFIMVEAFVESAIVNLKKCYQDEVDKPEPMSEVMERMKNSIDMLDVLLRAIKQDRSRV